MSRKTKHHTHKNRLWFAIPLAGEFLYSRFLTGSVVGRDPARRDHRIAGLLDLGIPKDRIITTAGVYLPEAHNGVVKLLLERRDCDGIVWLEHDHQFDYAMVERMEAYTERIVGVRYYTRDLSDPRMMVADFVNQTDPEATDPPFKIEYIAPSRALAMLADPGIYPIDFVPHGMTFVRRDVYEQLPYPWYKAGDRHELGDDVYFMAQAKKHGIPVHVDTALYAGHLSVGVSDDWWFVREQRRRWLELQFGHLCPPVLGGKDNAAFLPEGLKQAIANLKTGRESRDIVKSEPPAA